MSADGKTTGQRVISQFLETHRGQNSRVEPGIPVPVDKCTRPDPTCDNDDPTRPDPRVTGRVGFTRGSDLPASLYNILDSTFFFYFWTAHFYFWTAHFPFGLNILVKLHA